MEIRRLGEQIGAEITGVDVRTLDDAGFARIHRAWLDYNVIKKRGRFTLSLHSSKSEPDPIYSILILAAWNTRRHFASSFLTFVSSSAGELPIASSPCDFIRSCMSAD